MEKEKEGEVGREGKKEVKVGRASTGERREVAYYNLIRWGSPRGWYNVLRST